MGVKTQGVEVIDSEETTNNLERRAVKLREELANIQQALVILQVHGSVVVESSDGSILVCPPGIRFPEIEDMGEQDLSNLTG